MRHVGTRVELEGGDKGTARIEALPIISNARKHPAEES